MDLTALHSGLLGLLQRDEPSGLQMLIQLAVLAFFFLGPLLSRKKDDGKRGNKGTKRPKKSRPSEAEERGGDLWRQLLDLGPEPERPSPPVSSDPNVPELPRPVTEASGRDASAGAASTPTAPARTSRRSKLPPAPPKRSKPTPPRRREPLAPTPNESEMESGAGYEDSWAEAGRGGEDQLEAGGSSEEALERGGAIQRESLAELSGLASRSLSESVIGAEVDDVSDDPHELARRASWRAAIIAAEVLGRPVALRDSDAEGPLGLRSH